MNYNLDEINKQIKENVNKVVNDAEKKYQSQIIECVNEIINHKNGKNYKFILLAGPSSAGKTTTSYLFKENLKNNGYNAKVVSIDNFYLERADTRVLPNGNKDFESLDALDWNLFGIKIKELIENKKTIMPIFDFVSGTKKFPEIYTTLNDNEIIIIEGLHALNSIIDNYVPVELAYKVYLNSESEFVDGDEKLLTKEDIKLIRRLLRDYKKRGISPEKTFTTWQDVLDGETKYITPNKDNADYKIDTTHVFEPGVYYKDVIELKNETKSNHERLNSIINTLEKFEKVPYELIPMSSLTQEFLGGNDN